MPEMSQQFENPGHTQCHSDSTIHRINHVINSYVRDGDTREDREPDNRPANQRNQQHLCINGSGTNAIAAIVPPGDLQTTTTTGVE